MNIKIKSKNEPKEINIKNCKCYCFVDIISINIFFEMKKHIKDFSRKTQIDAKPLCIIFGKVDSYIRKHD